MNVEVLYFAGCPSYEALLPRLRDLVVEHGGDPDAIALRAVETVNDAEAARFLGSPTVRIDGRDVEPTAEERDDFGLKCRLYRSEDGLVPIPPTPWIRAALGATGEPA